MEVTLDGILMCFWIASATQLLTYATCPNMVRIYDPTQPNLVSFIDKSVKYCGTLVLSITGGYLCSIFYLWKFIDGMRDQYMADDQQVDSKHIMFARGNWKK